MYSTRSEYISSAHILIEFGWGLGGMPSYHLTNSVVDF